ncbi:hypothetical protein [Micromonospora polyrhachis]|uniref:Uncharacterized protein n=1 Tax=Micromonospora polyrhachis TaxID=1282883 RepID=A0A7W7WR29_9ACTN|nr:hypothetical protein [Micromonospora polyrhachis]MBB4960665.1 hypothetical protein [Micromonospora polyrhachis]
MSTEETPTSSRRRLLRAGIAAGAGAGVSMVAFGSPASADADPVRIGQDNDAGSARTTLTGGSATAPALALTNQGSGAALVLQPTPWEKVQDAALRGSLTATPQGDLLLSGVDGTAMVNSSRWANHTMPITPVRILDTREVPRSSAYDQHIVGGRANVDSNGRLRAGTTIHLTVRNVQPAAQNQAIAAYVNLTVTGTVSPGFLSAHSSSVTRSAASSLNWWAANQILSNLVEVQLGKHNGNEFSFAIYAAAATSVVVDVSGLVLTVPQTL